MATATAKKTDEQSIAEELRKYNVSDIKIRPHIDPARLNMGLEKYGQVLFEGSAQEQQLRCTELNVIDKDGNRTVRYINGLDINAREVQDLPEEEKKARIKSITKTVALLEKELYGQNLDVNDKDFWTKTHLAPNNPEYWSTVNLLIGNEQVSLDPSVPKDLAIIIAAEAGGFDDIAPSYEIAVSSSAPYKWYVERRRDARIKEASIKLEKDRALSTLYELRNNTPQRLFYIAKNLLPIANSYKLKDDVGIWYIDLREYIEGEGIEVNKKLAPQKFLRWASTDEETLHIRAYVLEGAFLRKIITKADNRIYHFDSDTMLGGNLEEAVQFLKEPLHQNELDLIQADVEKVWNR